MKKKQGKAFTIVELVIVIAVIAILAAVLIPTFSTVIKKAKVSADEQAAANMNTALSAYAAESGINGTEDLDKVFSDIYGESYAKVLQPQSASYGYHFWYNVSANRVEVSLSSVIGANSAQAVSLSLTKSSSVGQFGVRGMVREGYVLLDTAGSRLAETVASFEGMATASDYSAALENLQSIRSDKYDSEVAQGFSAAVDNTAFVTDHGVFRDENATQISFDKGIQTLTGSLFINKEGEILQETLGGDQVVANVSGEVVLPASVNSVGSNALHFGTDSDAVVVVSSDTDVASVFLANSADVAISCGGNVYTIRGDELYCNGEAVEGVSLGYGAPVTAFEIGVQGAETAGGVYSVALDALSGDISLYARNFVSESVNYDSRVTWTLEKAPEGVQISSEGVLSGISAGEIVVRAEAVSDASVAASFTVRVGEINSVAVSLEKDGVKESVSFDETNTFQKTEMTGGEKIVYTFSVTPVTNFADVECSSEYTLKVLEGDAQFDGNTLLLPAAGLVRAELSFVNYPSVVRYFEFQCAAKVFDYDESAEFYRFGTVNPVSISYAEGTDLSELTIETEAFVNQSSNAAAVVSDDKTQLSFSGGGKIRIKAVLGGAVVDQFVVQIISGAVNVSDETQFVSDRSMCLTRDIVKSNGGIHVAKGCFLYGNGYTVTATESSYTHEYGFFVNLLGTMDNVSVIGVPVDNYYTTGEAPFSRTAATVYVNAPGAAIYNSYIKNGKYAVRLDGLSGRVTIQNTIIVSGAISLGVTGTSGLLDVYLKDIQIVQPRNADFMGAGFAFNEGGEEKVTLHFSGQNNVLQNFATKSDISKLPSDYQTALRTIWDRTELSKFKYSDGTDTYLHLGILALLQDANKKPAIVMEEGCNLYGMMSDLVLSELGANGMLYGFDRDKEGTLEYVNAHLASWLNSVPVKTFAYEPLLPTITVQNTQLRLELEKFDSTASGKELIESNVTAEKYGASLAVEISVEKISGQGSFNSSDLTFTGAGEYKVTYTVRDRFETDSIGNPTTYQYTVTLYVGIKAAPPQIEFTSGEKLNQDGIKKPQDLDLSDVEYQKEAKLIVNGIFGAGECDAEYHLTAAEFFGLEITAYDGTDITSQAEVTCNGKTCGVNGDLTIFLDNTPGDSTSRDKRYTRKYSVTISVTYQGMTAEETVMIVFYVPELSGVRWW